MDLGLTQHTLALKLGVVYPTVAAWESGASQPLAARWPAIEAILGPGLVPEQVGLPGMVRTARLRLGLTQEALTLKAGVDLRTVRNVERGAHWQRRQTLRRLRAPLGPWAGRSSEGPSRKETEERSC